MSDDAKWLAENVVLPAIDGVETRLTKRIDDVEDDMKERDRAIWKHIGKVEGKTDKTRRELGVVRGYIKGRINGNKPLTKPQQVKDTIIIHGPKTAGYSILMAIVYLVIEYLRNGGG